MSNSAKLLLWQRPRLRPHRRERHATWMELFYDLVFVVAVAELGHSLAHDVSLIGGVKFAGLFITVLWAWVHHTFFSDRFDTGDLSHRVLTLIQMLAVAALAASISGALGKSAVPFAFAQIGIRGVQIVMYLRCRSIEVARPLANRLIGVFAIGSLIWLASVFVPAPIRFALWVLAVGMEVATIWHRSTRMKYAKMPLSESHLPERFGLFTIIVLGEAVAGVIAGLADATFTPSSTITAALGILTVFSLWMVYFQNIDPGVLRGIGGWSVVTWVYIHFPLMISITAFGVGVEHTIAEGMEHSLKTSDILVVILPLLLAFVTMAIMHFAATPSAQTTGHLRKAFWRLGAAFAVAVMGIIVAISDGNGVLLLSLLFMAGVSQVIADLFILESVGAAE